ncbi:serpin B4 [Nephila pilipes]|uniref:Serpin B4 n=1 Tax=Nephila pilipes TaxID=299642 RepID=A0A8X6TVY0_NEPPI|nr:serpin B4 [Nephila pilipes]
MRNTMGFEKVKLSHEDVHVSLNYLLTNAFVSTKNYTLTSANALLIDKRFKVLTEYKNKIEDSFQAKVEDVDFSKEASKAEQLINNWVNSKTNGKIPRLVEKLHPDTVVALFNAVYFKGLWKTQFDKQNTKEAKFYNYGVESKAKLVPTMHINMEISYALFPDCKIVELPYQFNNFSMIILLNKKDNKLEDIEKNLTVQKIAEIRKKLSPTELEISLPKLRLESSIDLKQHLESVGLQHIFKETDFSGMTENSDVVVTKVNHKALVEVNEEGTEAAAATGGELRPIIAKQSFKVNHPFLFAIIHTKSDALLFIGRVMSM